jgi:hypothetical protein
MSDEKLKQRLDLLPPLFILMGTADDNTIPATQGGFSLEITKNRHNQFGNVHL